MKVVQVPMDEKEALELATLAKKMRISRADLIRRACSKYLQGLRDESLDQGYERGYRAIPEDLTIGSTSAALAATFLGPEGRSR